MEPKDVESGLPWGQLVWITAAATLLVGSTVPLDHMGRSSLPFLFVFGPGVGAAMISALYLRRGETARSLAVVFLFGSLGAALLASSLLWVGAALPS
jgi:hypothetical protein